MFMSTGVHLKIHTKVKGKKCKKSETGLEFYGHLIINILMRMKIIKVKLA